MLNKSGLDRFQTCQIFYCAVALTCQRNARKHSFSTMTFSSVSSLPDWFAKTKSLSLYGVRITQLINGLQKSLSVTVLLLFLSGYLGVNKSYSDLIDSQLS